jgi:hypothetical protein
MANVFKPLGRILPTELKLVFSNDIKKAYEHHKIQIMQLKNEIAVLKSSQSIKLETNKQNEELSID